MASQPSSRTGPGTPTLRTARPLIQQALALVEQSGDRGAEHVAIVLRLALRALESRRVDVTSLIDTGHRLEDLGRFELAAEFYTEAVRLEPDAPRGWTNLGEARRKLQHWEPAVDAYQRAIAVDPQYVWALAGLGESLRMMGRLEEALQPFEQALQRSPDNLFCLQGLAAALSELGRHREALPHWEHAVRLRPDSGFASDGLSECHRALAAV